MGMGLSGGFAAGAGADALEELLKQAFMQQLERKRASQDDQRIQLEGERNKQAAEMQRAQLASLDESRKAAAQDRETTTMRGVLNMIPKGTTVAPDVAARARAAGFGTNVRYEAADLPSTAISGMAQAGTKAPLMGTLRMAAAGHPERDTFTGTAEQDAAEQARQDKLAQIEQARKDREETAARTAQERKDAATAAQQGREDLARLGASLRPPASPPVMVITTPDGKTQVVPKVAGATYDKSAPPNAALENRVASARVVNKVGQGMIDKLSDPKFANVVGPAMGRAGTLRDFIGNPPPQFSELAGQIESYALANMGVHGMRSAQGAQKITELLDKHHTPASLAATIRGLNEFSTQLVKDYESKHGGGEPTTKSGGFTVQEIKD